MLILNITPDSFSDGGKYFQNFNCSAISHQPSAIVFDIGGESTRPGFTPVSAEEEMRRVLPVVKMLRETHPDCWISIDTHKAVVAQAALETGADIVNDVSGASDPDMLGVVRKYNAGYVLTHGWEEHLRLNGKWKMENEKCSTPPAILHSPFSILHWVLEGLREMLGRILEAEVPASNVVLDPGFGFGKKGMQNRELLDALPEICAAFEQPVLVGVSRKHFLAEMYGVEKTRDLAVLDALSERCAREAVEKGARIVRTHTYPGSPDPAGSGDPGYDTFSF